jgi:hypothetical protein
MLFRPPHDAAVSVDNTMPASSSAISRVRPVERPPPAAAPGTTYVPEAGVAIAAAGASTTKAPAGRTPHWSDALGGGASRRPPASCNRQRWLSTVCTSELTVSGWMAVEAAGPALETRALTPERPYRNRDGTESRPSACSGNDAGRRRGGQSSRRPVQPPPRICVLASKPLLHGRPNRSPQCWIRPAHRHLRATGFVPRRRHPRP